MYYDKLQSIILINVKILCRPTMKLYSKVGICFAGRTRCAKFLMMLRTKRAICTAMSYEIIN